MPRRAGPASRHICSIGRHVLDGALGLLHFRRDVSTIVLNSNNVRDLAIVGDTTPRSRELLVKAARMYFLDGRSQGDIARVLETSRSNVSRMLSTARALGIVEIRIQDERGRDADLEEALAERFRLTHVRVAVFRPHQDALAAPVPCGRGVARRHAPRRPDPCAFMGDVRSGRRRGGGGRGSATVEVVPLVGGLATDGSSSRARSSSASWRPGSVRRTGTCTDRPCCTPTRRGTRCSPSRRSARILARARSADLALVEIGTIDSEPASGVLTGLSLTDAQRGPSCRKIRSGTSAAGSSTATASRSAASCTTGCSRWILTTSAASRR